MKERNLKLDNAKGILITLVVIGHMLLPIQGTTRGVTNFFYMIYAFHMPAFVFISGLLAQRIYIRVPKQAHAPAENCAQRHPHHATNVSATQQVTTVGHFNGHRWCSTLWLYLLFQFILFFSEIPAYGRTTRFPDFLHTSGAPWYLLALLLWYLMIPFFAGCRGKVLPLRPACSNRRHQPSERRAQSDEGLQAGRAQRGIPCSLIAWILLTGLSLAGGYLASGALAGIGDFLALDRVIAFAPFFFAGYFIGPERLMEFLGGKQESIAAPKRATSRRRSPEGTSKRADRGIVLVLTALGLLCFVLIGTQTFDRLLPYRNVVYGAWYYRFHPEQNPAAFPGALSSQLWLIRLAWFLVSGLMSFTLLALMPNRQIPLLTTIGQRTLQIYILHRPIRDLLLASGFITAAGPENSLHVLLLIALSLLMTLVLSAGILQRLFDAIQKLPDRLR
ncbi:MAG: acyltransferase family protein [Oribacterium sp.]|nr:acyltransferase family protein [Oribacterium sp.]